VTRKPAPPASPSRNKRASTHRRIRLTPEVRRQQILEAALSEFSAVGFEGATMERIARKVGITKAGLYAHFTGKNEIFEALLVGNMLTPSLSQHWICEEGGTLTETVDHFVESVYRKIREPQTTETFRLLLAEGGRSPARMQQWHSEIFKPYLQERQAFMDDCIAKGLTADTALSRHFLLAFSPALLAMLWQMMLGGEEAQREIDAIQSSHRELLLTLLAHNNG